MSTLEAETAMRFFEDTDDSGTEPEGQEPQGDATGTEGQDQAPAGGGC